ncbi:MAG: hypothetical protein DCC49_09460 [Acidobacteria bacterium]|nr:MAG: hypothetical protein DCC49_09460 [Acidobacteriota bacterium]
MVATVEPVEYAVATLASMVGEAERDPIEVYQAIADEALRCFDATAIVVWLPSRREPGATTLNAIVTAGEISPDILRLDVPIEGTLLGRAFADHEPLLIGDFQSPRTPALSKVLNQAFNMRSAIVVPLRAKGILALLGQKPNQFSDKDMALARSFASLASAAYGMSERAALVERERLMAELHDGAIQVLYGALLELDLAADQDSQQDTRAHVSISAELIREGLDELRDSVLSMNAAQQSLAQRIRRSAMLLGKRTFITVDMQGEDLGPAHPWTEDLARIQLEATSNAIRHGKAKNVAVKVTNDEDRLTMEIIDDGHGFESSGKRAGLGMRNMPRRADRIGADFNVSSIPGKGTKVTVAIEKAGARAYLPQVATS